MFYHKEYAGPGQSVWTPKLRFYYNISDNHTELLGYTIYNGFGENMNVVQLSDDFERARLAIIAEIPTADICRLDVSGRHNFVFIRSIEDQVRRFGALTSTVVHDVVAKKVDSGHLCEEEVTAFKLWRPFCHDDINIEYIDRCIDKETTPLFRFLNEVTFVLTPNKVLVSKNGGQLTDISDTQTGEHWFKTQQFPDFSEIGQIKFQ